MNTRKNKLRAVLLTTAAVLVLSVPLLAHHGTAISYDQDHPITLKGRVTELSWRNPHSILFFEVMDEKGNTISWAGEMGAAAVMSANGWPKARAMEALKPGVPITVTLAPSKIGAHVGEVRSILSEKGERLLSGRETPRPQED